MKYRAEVINMPECAADQLFTVLLITKVRSRRLRVLRDAPHKLYSLAWVPNHPNPLLTD